jgi:hypothetical protein
VGKTISLFMWGYQSHFCFSVEYQARQVLQAVAPAIEPRAILIGIRTPEKRDGHPVCVEPEDQDWDPILFFGCFARADEIYRTHPDHSFFYGDEPSMRDKPENIRKQSALEAVMEVISVYDEKHRTQSFCGRPGRVDGYYVVPVIQINKARLDEQPRLPLPIKFGEWESLPSFLDAIIGRLLADSTVALGDKEPGRSLLASPSDVTAVLRRAADQFCIAITLATEDISFQNIFDNLNVISAIPYEGRETIGEILFLPPNAKEVEIRVRFEKSVPLSQHRLVRKVVEMTGQTLTCLCHGSTGINGLGTLRAVDNDNAFRAVFTGHYKWDLYYKNILLMKTAFGVPRLPAVRLSHNDFCSTARRVFADLQANDEQRLWSIIQTCMEQRHGTMLVISKYASEEADRLKNQSIGIEATELTPELVRRLSGIDGAILVSPKGACHAIGVILDGIATDGGDSSRGSRYNSAIRYLASSHSSTLCLVVSEDGYIDMLPMLRPQIRKSEIDFRIETLKTKGIHDFHKTIGWLQEHRFYLTASECEVVNREVGRIYSTPMELGDIRFEISPFVPHAAMNDTYYSPEA